MEETGWLVERRATRGVRDEDEGRTGEDVGMNNGVELRTGGDDGVPRWDDIVDELSALGSVVVVVE